LTETLLDGFSSSESLLVEDEALRFKPLVPLTDGLFKAEPLTRGFWSDFWFIVGLLSSESLLLLDEAAFFTGFCVDLTGTTDAFLFVSSSDESESDDVSFFLLFESLAGDGTAVFLTTDVTLVLFGVDGACFLLAGGATSSESELELDEGALRLIDWVDTATFGLVGCFFSSSSDESEEDVSSFFSYSYYLIEQQVL